MADYTGHTTALEAATIAQKAGVKKLILGHFSNRYADLNVFTDEARTVFPNTFLPKMLETIKNLMDSNELKDFLNEKADLYNHPNFIEQDLYKYRIGFL